MTGRVMGAATAQDYSETIQLNYISSLVTQCVWVAQYPCIVTDIRGRTRVAGSGGACTMQFFKVPDVTTVANGTLLHSGSFNLVGTADTNQILTMVTNPDSLTLKAGDGIGYVLTGTATSAVGTVTVSVEPVS